MYCLQGDFSTVRIGTLMPLTSNRLAFIIHENHITCFHKAKVFRQGILCANSARTATPKKLFSQMEYLPSRMYADIPGRELIYGPPCHLYSPSVQILGMPAPSSSVSIACGRRRLGVEGFQTGKLLDRSSAEEFWKVNWHHCRSSMA